MSATCACSTCYESSLQKHIRKCPTRLANEARAHQPWYRLDINAGSVAECPGSCSLQEQAMNTSAARCAHSFQLGIAGMRKLFERVRHAATLVRRPVPFIAHSATGVLLGNILCPRYNMEVMIMGRGSVACRPLHLLTHGVCGGVAYCACYQR